MDGGPKFVSLGIIIGFMCIIIGFIMGIGIPGNIDIPGALIIGFICGCIFGLEACTLWVGREGIFGGVAFMIFLIGNCGKDMPINIGFAGGASLCLFAFGSDKFNSLGGVVLLEKARREDISSGDIGFPMEDWKGAREG